MAVVAAAPQISPAVAGIIVASPGLASEISTPVRPHRRSAFPHSSSRRARTVSSRRRPARSTSDGLTDKRLVLVPGTRHGYELVLTGDVASNRALFEEFLAKHLGG